MLFVRKNGGKECYVPRGEFTAGAFLRGNLKEDGKQSWDDLLEREITKTYY